MEMIIRSPESTAVDEVTYEHASLKRSRGPYLQTLG